MRMLLTAALAIVALIAATPALAPISGAWDMQRSSDGTLLHLHVGPHEDETLHGYAVPAGQLYGAPSAAEFTVAREPGTFRFRGTIGGGTGSGNFTFTPSSSFNDGLAARGLGTRDGRELMGAASVDLTLAYIDRMRADGYPALTFENALAFRAIGVTTESIAVLRGLFGSLSAEDVISTSALHVTPAYVQELREMGVSPVTAQRAVEFKALNITRDYVAQLASLGYPHLRPNQIVEFRALHIDAAYLKHLADHGLKNLTPEQVVELKATGL